MNHAERRPVKVILHNACQAFAAEILDRAQPFGDDFAVAAVAAEHVVMHLEVDALPDGGAFLPYGKMGRACVGIGDGIIRAQLLNVVEHGLKFANERHVAVNAQQPFGTEAFLVVQFLTDAFLVTVDRDFAKVDGGALPDLFRNNH